MEKSEGEGMGTEGKGRRDGNHVMVTTSHEMYYRVDVRR